MDSLKFLVPVRQTTPPFGMVDPSASSVLMRLSPIVTAARPARVSFDEKLMIMIQGSSAAAT